MFAGLGMGIAALGGAALQSDAARDAAGTQAAATDRAIGVTERQYNQTRKDQAPYRASGKSALQQLMSFMGMPEDTQQSAADQYLRQNPDVAADGVYGSDPYQHWVDHGKAEGRAWPTPAPASQAPDPNAPLARKFSVDDFWQDPVTQLGYQQGLDLGTKAMKNMAPLTFGADSGAAIKEATKFGQDYAGSKAGESYNRFEGDKSNVFNRLMAMIGGGQVANQVDASAGANTAGANAGLISAGGNAQAASQIAGSNAIGGALGNIANWWQQNATMDKLMKGVRGAGGNISSWAQQNYGTPGYYALGEG